MGALYRPQPSRAVVSDQMVHPHSLRWRRPGRRPYNLFAAARWKQTLETGANHGLSEVDTSCIRLRHHANRLRISRVQKLAWHS